MYPNIASSNSKPGFHTNEPYPKTHSTIADRFPEIGLKTRRTNSIHHHPFQLHMKLRFFRSGTVWISFYNNAFCRKRWGGGQRIRSQDGGINPRNRRGDGIKSKKKKKKIGKEKNKPKEKKTSWQNGHGGRKESIWKQMSALKTSPFLEVCSCDLWGCCGGFYKSLFFDKRICPHIVHKKPRRLGCSCTQISSIDHKKIRQRKKW